MTATSPTGRVLAILRKDLRLGPRSPLVLWALVVPVAITLLVRGVFGDLFGAEPRLGIVDEGDSAITASALEIDGIDVRIVTDRATLRDEVADGVLDAGVVLGRGFDDEVRSGANPPLVLWLSGTSSPADRGLLTVAIIDLVRRTAGDSAPVDVEVVELGEQTLPLDLRLLPLLVMYAVAIPGGMVPASSLVEEKERGTMQPLLTTPTSVGELLIAKGLLGVLLATVAELATLLLNDAFGTAPLAVTLAIVVGGVMMAQIGLILGCWARDTNTLFAAWKGGGLVLFLPVVFFLWPGLPLWPAQLMPTFYFLRPAYAVGVEGARLADIATDLAIAAGICVALLPLVAAAGRRMHRRLLAGAGSVRTRRGAQVSG